LHPLGEVDEKNQNPLGEVDEKENTNFGFLV